MVEDREGVRREPGSDGGAVVAGRSYLRACLLLALAERPGYGYGLVDAFEGLGIVVDGRTRVYRALREMEQDGLVSSWWVGSPSGGPPRRMYGLTDAGAGALERDVQLVVRGRRALGRFLDRYRRVRVRGAVASA